MTFRWNVPNDQFGKDALERENNRLKSSLKRCRATLDEYRSKLAANANGDYRPPYKGEDDVAGRGGEAS
jgi:hypothetical protein